MGYKRTLQLPNVTSLIAVQRLNLEVFQHSIPSPTAFTQATHPTHSVLPTMDNMTPDPSPQMPPSLPEIQSQIDQLEQAHKQKGFPISGRIIHLCHHLPVEITRVFKPAAAGDGDAAAAAGVTASDGSDLSSSSSSRRVNDGGAAIEISDEHLAAGSIPHPSVAALQAANGINPGPGGPVAVPSSPTSGSGGGVLSPPRTPEFKESDTSCFTSSDGTWKLSGRRGHTAMISGMRSLSTTHEQFVVAWTGDIMQEQQRPPVSGAATPTSRSGYTSFSAAGAASASSANGGSAAGSGRGSPLRRAPGSGPVHTLSTAPGQDSPGQPFEPAPPPSLSRANSTYAVPQPSAAHRSGSGSSSSSSTNGGSNGGASSSAQQHLQQQRDAAAATAAADAEASSHIPANTEKSVYVPELTDDERRALETELGHFSDFERKREKDIGKMSYLPVFVPPEVAKGHYEGYCKATLWPLFHYLLWMDTPTDLPSPDPSWEHYQQTNRLFAERAASIYQPGDLIIVHDYHLLLAPDMIRQALKGRKDIREPEEVAIGLFVHTPWPSSEVFRCLPRRKEILDGMLGANHVCFQTYSYSRHFKSTCIRVSAFESTPQGINANGRVTSVGYCPIGIDADRVTVDRDRPGVAPRVEALRTMYKGKKLIVSREKMDVAKGVYNKFQAFEKFLACYPEWRGKVVLIQVTTPALTEVPDLDRKVAELVSRVNGTYGTLDFAPIHHYNQAIDRDEYFALLSAADMALITSLRDGMNTTSMEFVLCQDKTNRSPLVLSEFMGTSAAFTSALLINPHDLLGVAKAINQGLKMSSEEKTQRHQELIKSVKAHTSHTWARTLLKQLLENVGLDHQAHQTPALDREAMKAAYRKANRRLMLFDYDGTLTPIVKIPSDATPTQRTKDAIRKLAADENNVVYIVSGRDADFLEEWWGDVPNLGMSAEHGSFVREPDADEWTNMTEALDMSWMNEVEEIFQYYTERTTGSRIEVKKASITWHYRQADPDFA